MSEEQPISSDELSISSAEGIAVPLPTPRLHNLWQCETVVFKAENTLFAVLKQGLMAPGSVFADMFALPTNSQVEGRDMDNPIILQGTVAADFSAFLSVIYPWLGGKKKQLKETEGRRVSSTVGVKLSIDQWTGVLCLANRWNYVDVRNEAIGVLNDLLLPGSEKIRIGMRYHVESWVKDGYYDIIKTIGLNLDALAGAPNNFDQETMTKIFYVQAASLAHLGGAFCQGSGCSYGTHSQGCNAKRNELKDARTLIDTVFKDDIASAYYNPDTKVM